jgi:hypothetical protein
MKKLTNSVTSRFFVCLEWFSSQFALHKLNLKLLVSLYSGLSYLGALIFDAIN